MTRDVYVTGIGAYLPGDPLDNDEIARRLGDGDGTGRALRERVLAHNGIRTRHYALDERGQPTMLNEELAAHAVTLALKHSGHAIDDVTMLATGTTQGDLIVPGFASMVHGRLGGGPMELLSAGGVCASSLAALRGAAAGIRLGEHEVAVAVGSELVSRALRRSRYAPAGGRARFDAEFLRWTLSDGAGAVVLADRPRADGLSLRLDWTHLVSYAHAHPVCMRAGLGEDGGSWLDQPDAATAERAGQLVLRQDVSTLPALFRLGLTEFTKLVRAGRLNPSTVDHVLCHYSSEHFRGEILAMLKDAGLALDEHKWFTNLHTAGNTGAASIFVMLREAWESGRFRQGDSILLIVPESGRFSFGFAHLTCVAPAVPAAPAKADPEAQLARVWTEFEDALAAVPIVRRIEDGTVTLGDYRRLLLNLRQQVVEGGRWIARAASNFSVELFELRSAAIRHAAEEHRDFRLLERDYVAVGGDLDEIRSAPKNPGSEALSAFLFHQASQPDPVDLLGAMFVIEGLGAAKVSGWAGKLREHLGLTPEQMTFLEYHGEADDGHLGVLRGILGSGTLDEAAVARVVRTATVVARLYAWQLAAIDD